MPRYQRSSEYEANGYRDRQIGIMPLHAPTESRLLLFLAPIVVAAIVVWAL